MGATSGYHPISLHVIRGAAEFCGWKFGKIQRFKSAVQEGYAEYKVYIVKSPRGSDDWPPKVFRRQLQHCFMDDIKVTQVELSTHRPPYAYLKVQVGRTPMDEALETQ